MEIEVKEASRRLGVNDSRVRQLLRAGDLRGRHVGNSWLILADDVARLERIGRRPGRPLAPKRAWAVIDLLEGGGARWLPDSARSQVRNRLEGLDAPSSSEWLALLRGRSHVLEVVGHPAALERLRRVKGVCAAGAAAAGGRGFDLVVLADRVPEYYVADGHWDQLASSLALHESREPNVRIRIPREIWPFSDEGQPVPNAALAADLLESPEPRSVSAGAERLKQLLAEWQQGRRR
ncbi:MAG TPA: helix-turn-helix domain-containing protein [Nocardioidaceae bacterium]|nr:helix-turn-helix domain-containing protein [Nocardioidaceae bacterium]